MAVTPRFVFGSGTCPTEIDAPLIRKHQMPRLFLDTDLGREVG